MARPPLHLSGDPEADALLSADPLALVIGMVLDQQVRLELAFSAPSLLARRLGEVGRSFDAATIAGMDPEQLGALFAARPALHRYPGSMAARVQALCAVVVDQYGGDASRVWSGAADGPALLAAVKALPGFGDQKARIFVALLGKQLGVRPPGWEKVSAPYGDPGSHRSVADITDAASMERVRDFKRTMKAGAKATPAASPRSPAAKASPAKGRGGHRG